MTEQEQKIIFADNLSRYIDQFGVTKGKLAEVAGVTNGAVTQWVQGVTLPRMDKIQTIADFFGVQVTDLIDKRADTDDFRDRLFEERHVLFDLLEKATPHQLDLVENLLKMFTEESDE